MPAAFASSLVLAFAFGRRSPAPAPGWLAALAPAGLDEVQLAILATAALLFVGLAVCLQLIRSSGGGGAGGSRPRVGVVGLGVMGSQLLLNLSESLGETIAGLDTDGAKARGAETAAAAEGLSAVAFTSPSAFVRALQRPRTVMLLVPAGAAVDAVLAKLVPYLRQVSSSGWVGWVGSGR